MRRSINPSRSVEIRTSHLNIVVQSVIDRITTREARAEASVEVELFVMAEGAAESVRVHLFGVEFAVGEGPEEAVAFAVALCVGGEVQVFD